MRVLALVHQYVPVRNAGAETMVHAMLRALVRAGHDVHASLSLQVGDPYVYEGVHVWPRPEEKLKAQHSRHIPGSDVLVAHLENSQAAAFLGHLSGIPTVIVQHNTFDATRDLPGIHAVRIDLAVVNSHWMADYLDHHRRIRKVPSPRTIVVRPLVDRAEWPPLDEPGDAVTLLNLRGKEKDGGKGAETFWAAAYRMPDTEFVGVLGAYGRQLTIDLPNVDILEHVSADKVRDEVYARTRVLLVPSYYESWGRVATEATACGIPVIANPTPGLRENLGDAGIYVHTDDVDGYVRELRRLADPDEYAKARALALQRAVEHERMRVEDEARWVSEVERLA